VQLTVIMLGDFAKNNKNLPPHLRLRMVRLSLAPACCPAQAVAAQCVCPVWADICTMSMRAQHTHAHACLRAAHPHLWQCVCEPVGRTNCGGCAGLVAREPAVRCGARGPRGAPLWACMTPRSEQTHPVTPRHLDKVRCNTSCMQVQEDFSWGITTQLAGLRAADKVRLRLCGNPAFCTGVTCHASMCIPARIGRLLLGVEARWTSCLRPPPRLVLACHDRYVGRG
jgi:hypothetical protein